MEIRLEELRGAIACFKGEPLYPFCSTWHKTAYLNAFVARQLLLPYERKLLPTPQPKARPYKRRHPWTVGRHERRSGRAREMIRSMLAGGPLFMGEIYKRLDEAGVELNYQYVSALLRETPDFQLIPGRKWVLRRQQ